MVDAERKGGLAFLGPRVFVGLSGPLCRPQLQPQRISIRIRVFFLFKYMVLLLLALRSPLQMIRVKLYELSSDPSIQLAVYFCLMNYIYNILIAQSKQADS